MTLDEMLEKLESPERVEAILSMAEILYNQTLKIGSEQSELHPGATKLNPADLMLCGFMIAGISLRESLPDKDIRIAEKVIKHFGKIGITAYLEEVWKERGVNH